MFSYMAGGDCFQAMERVTQGYHHTQCCRKVFCNILNNRLVQCLDKEGGTGFNRRCMDNVYTLNEIVQGTLRKDNYGINCGTWV